MSFLPLRKGFNEMGEPLEGKQKFIFNPTLTLTATFKNGQLTPPDRSEVEINGIKYSISSKHPCVPCKVGFTLVTEERKSVFGTNLHYFKGKCC